MKTNRGYLFTVCTARESAITTCLGLWQMTHRNILYRKKHGRLQGCSHEKLLAWGSCRQASKKWSTLWDYAEAHIWFSLASPELETGANMREVGKSWPILADCYRGFSLQLPGLVAAEVVLGFLDWLGQRYHSEFCAIQNAHLLPFLLIQPLKWADITAA